MPPTRSAEMPTSDPPPVVGEERPAGLGAALAMASGLGLAISLQYAAQPYLWRHWPVEEVVSGWLYVLRDSVAAALAMAPAMLLALRLPPSPPAARVMLVGAAAFIGAALGQGAVGWFEGDSRAVASLASHALRWTVVAFAMTAVLLLWRRHRAQREALREATLRQLELDEQATRASLGALQSQIEPHFLFNTLGTVRQLHRTDPEPGARLLGQFLDYLQRMLAMHDRVTVPLGEELDLVHSYLEVVAARMQGRLRFSMELPAELRGIELPPWSVCTLVENAVKHGIAPLARGGAIRVTARADAGSLELLVADDGAGLGTGGAGGSGLGLSNVRARLATLYGQRASLWVEDDPAGGVRACLRVPVETRQP